MIITAIIADTNENLNHRIFLDEVLEEVAEKFSPENPIPVVDGHLVKNLGDGRTIGYVTDLLFSTLEGNLYAVMDLENPKKWGYQGFWTTVGEYIWSDNEKNRTYWKENHNVIPIFNAELFEDNKTIAWADLLKVSLSGQKSAFKNSRICEISDIPKRIDFTTLDGKTSWLCNFHITHKIGTTEDLDFEKETKYQWAQKLMKPGDELVWFDDIGCLSGSAGYAILRGTQVVATHTIMRS
jgi:hypothetical protein